MDYGDLMDAHLQSGADITLGATPVDRECASDFGIMHSDANRPIFRFEEKPKDSNHLDELPIPPGLLNELGREPGAELYQGSMAIYLFNLQVLIEALSGPSDRDRA
jgi:glucose-1-phosphate adenylyltransferase